MVNRQFVLGSLIAVSSAVALAVTTARQREPRPPPNAPSKTTAVAASESETDVSWQDNSTNELGFEVHRGTTGPNGSYSLLVTTSTNASSHSDGGLTASKQYCYKIRAFNTSGGTTRYSQFSAAACATTLAPPPPPNAPSNTTAVPVSESRTDVSWQDNSTNELGFEVHRGTTGPNGSYSLLVSMNTNASSYSDGGLTALTQYCYKIRAFNTSGGTTRYSEFSAAACATTPLPPPPPAPGAIQVTIATTGTCIDPWYFVQLDNGLSGYFGPNATITLAAVAPGDHTLWLGSVGPNCSVGENPRTVRVTSGGTTNVLFAVTCGIGNTITVTGATTGIDSDPDGYGIELWLSWDGRTWMLAGGGNVPANGSMTVCGLYTGEYELRVTEVAPNCSILTRTPFWLDLSYGGAARAELQAACAPIPQLAFVNVADGNAKIYVTNPSGNGAMRLTSNVTSDRQPAWSLDTAKIAFTSDRDGNPEVYAMNADGSNPVRLTTDGAYDADPAWSPDGTRIAFTTDRDGNFEIYAMNADGSNPVRLTYDTANDGDPAWSPDGTKVAFTSDRDGKSDIYVTNSDGSGVARLTNDPAMATRGADWSPDGTKIAFSGQSCSGPTCSGAIFVMNADGSGVRQLACCDARDPVWSPDGRKIAFTNNVSQSPRIAVVTAEGTNLVELLSGSDPSWRRGSTCVPTSPIEICNNGVDDDCNGLVDAADPACIPPVCDCQVDPYGPGCYGEDGMNICVPGN
jgi:Tol biopolymer transport system component